MGWEDKARENLYLQHSLRANNEEDLQRGIQAADETIDFLKDIGNAIGDALTSKPSAPPPPPQPSSGGNIAGKVLAGAAIAGGAFLLSKLFGSSDDKQVNKPKNNSESITRQTNKQAQQKNNKVKLKNNSNVVTSLKDDFNNIEILIEKPRKSNEGVKKALKKLENKINSQRNKEAMNKIAGYYKKIRCDGDAERCYQIATTFN